VGDLNAAPPRRAPSWIAPLAVTLCMQTEAAFLMRALPVIGPSITEAAGVPPEMIGVIAGIVAGGTMWFLIGGSLLLTYFGPVRLLQLGAIVATAGIVATLSGSWAIMLVAAFAIGVGYGPSPPAGSEILTRAAPPGRRSLIMSIKQSGVPLGGAIAGILLPPIVESGGWRASLLACAVLALGAALLVQPWRARLDAARDASRAPTLGNLFSPSNLRAPFVVLRENPCMVPITIAGFAFACVQGCLLTFFVTQLTTEVGFTLAVAGAAFSAMQLSGTFARVFMGWLADKIGGRNALMLLATCSCAMILVVARIDVSWPLWVVVVIGLMAGITSTSWNGVYLAEVARLSPPGKVGDATSGSTFFTFGGYLLAPIVFAYALPFVGSYGRCFVALAAIALTVVPVLWLAARRVSASSSP
jgi:MFS family permease